MPCSGRLKPDVRSGLCNFFFSYEIKIFFFFFNRFSQRKVFILLEVELLVLQNMAREERDV